MPQAVSTTLLGTRAASCGEFIFWVEAYRLPFRCTILSIAKLSFQFDLTTGNFPVNKIIFMYFGSLQSGRR
jgi:hypothetical protein